jgi:enamine deaminase RidA (YjgF/YER057c/UK114 family)
MVTKIDAKISKRGRHLAGLAVIVTAGSLAACAHVAPPGPVVRTGAGTAAISSTVTEPVGYETIYLSGMTGTLRAPDGSAPGTPASDPGDTEAQATRALGNIKNALASQGLGLGDIVMMHAYLAPDPKTGRGDSAGWSRAYLKFFGAADQPNKPSRTSITVVLGSPTAKIEIETIAVRKPAGKM